MKKSACLLICFTLLIINCKSNYSNKYSNTPIVLKQPEKYETYEECLSLITKKVGLNEIVRDNEYTPLTMAVFYGYMDIVEELLLKGVAIDRYDGFGRTPLLTAIEVCDLDMVELLIDNGADVNKRANENDAFILATSYGEFGEEAPIHVACKNGIIPIVELLIKNGADVNSQYNHSGSALKDARLLVEDKGILRTLINAGAEASIHDYSYIGDIETIKAYLARDKKLINQKDVVGYTPLHIAAIEGYDKIAKLLIENSADINAQDVSGVTPLMYAVMNSHNDVAKLLIDSNAALDIESNYGRNALCYSAEENNEEIKEYLIAKGAEINVDAAVTIGDIERIKTLIESGIDLDKTISGYGTLLTLAVHYGQIEIAQLLIDNGVDVNKALLEHQYPIVQGIETNNEDMVKMLLKNGAAIDLRETTALHIASRMGFAKMSEILIDNGADVNAKDISGKTPIYEACYYGDKDTIKLLLDNGAKIASGESAYRILNEPVKNGNTEIVQILLGNSENIFLQEEKIKENLIKIAMDYGYTDIVELLGGDAKQISESKKCGPYSIIVTNPESVTKYLEFRSISFDDIWIPETKLIKEIESSLSVTFPSNNYVGQKATYKDSISNNEIIRNYCKEYSGFIYRDKKYIICNMIEGLEKPFANKFHRLDSYDRDVKCIIIDAKTMEIEKLIDESRLFMPYY